MYWILQKNDQQRWKDQKLLKKKRRNQSKKVTKDEGNITEAGDCDNRGKRKRSEGRGNQTEGGIVLQEKDTEAFQCLKYFCYQIFIYYCILYFSFCLAEFVLKICPFRQSVCKIWVERRV